MTPSGKVSGGREEKKKVNRARIARARSDLIRWPRRAPYIFLDVRVFVASLSDLPAARRRVARNAVIVYHDYARRSKSSWKLVQGLFWSFALFFFYFFFFPLSLRCSILGRNSGKIHRDSAIHLNYLLGASFANYGY